MNKQIRTLLFWVVIPTFLLIAALYIMTLFQAAIACTE